MAQGTGGTQYRRLVGEPDEQAARDRAVVERQIGRAPRAFRRVAVRCPYDKPAVTEQHPYDEAGEPFPTTYYLTCPHAVAVIARAEAAGGVERWSERVAGDPELRASAYRAAARQRAIRRRLARGWPGVDGGSSLRLGIGGAFRPAALKCLHAHVAFALAEPGYELGDRIVADLAEPLFPDTGCCTPAGP